MKSICLAIVVVGLCLVAPVSAQDYRPLDWRKIDLTGPEATTFFADDLLILKASDPALHDAYLTKVDHPNGPLIFAVWVGPGICGQYCRLEILDDHGDHLGGAPVCVTPNAIEIDPSNQFVRLCSGTATPIVDLFRNMPPTQARQTLDLWQAQDIAYMNHNGSIVAVSPAQGTIRYERVRAGLRGSIADGTLLFQGKPWKPGGPFNGVAYTFRKGCEPASYDVIAHYEGLAEILTLRGDAPTRANEGCEVVGYSASSDNAVLTFDFTFD